MSLFLLHLPLAAILHPFLPSGSRGSTEYKAQSPKAKSLRGEALVLSLLPAGDFPSQENFIFLIILTDRWTGIKRNYFLITLEFNFPRVRRNTIQLFRILSWTTLNKLLGYRLRVRLSLQVLTTYCLKVEATLKNSGGLISGSRGTNRCKENL